MGNSYYLREVRSRRSRCGEVAYLYISESSYDRKTRTTKVRNVLSLGRKDRLDLSTIARLSCQLQNYLDGSGSGDAAPDVEISSSRLLGPISFYRGLWNQLGLGELSGRCLPKEWFGFRSLEAVFALTLYRLLEPAETAAAWWINQVAYFPELEGVTHDHLSRLDRLTASDLQAPLEAWLAGHRELLLAGEEPAAGHPLRDAELAVWVASLGPLGAMARAMQRTAETKTGLNHQALCRLLDPIKAVRIKIKGTKIVARTEVAPEMREVFEAADLEIPPATLQSAG
ncbi:MAG: hypothetical protein HC897_16190 [Thermoanaerobaculia bacterium]|nr:hypothetical protein [Thermoanaerobaculia bacterium]